MNKNKLKSFFVFISGLTLIIIGCFFGMCGRISAEAALIGKISGISGADAGLILDANEMTSYKAERIDITITAENKFTAAYIVWNNIPARYAITYKDKSTVISDGFLHKLIEFDEPVESFVLKSDGGGELCDIYLFKGNNYPDFVQKWEPPHKQADIFVLAAHADDEYLMFGGTIPYYVKERGLRVQVAYLTTHFKEQPRPHELLNGLYKAGVRNYPILGIISDIPLQPIFSLDQAAQLYDFNAVLSWLTEQLRRFKPSVTITHDINGEYGHGAHMLAAKMMQQAVEISASSMKFPDSVAKYGVWDVPKTYLHFWGENKITMNWEEPLESLGGITARDAAELSYGEHKSQHKWGFVVGYWEKYDCRQFGLYRTLVGTDEKADFMDHITPITDETTIPETEPIKTEPPPTEPIETVFYTTAPVSDSPKPPPDNTTNKNSLILICVLSTGALITLAAAGIVIRKRK